MVEAVIWLVVWVILTSVGTWLMVVLGILGGVGLATATDRVWPAPAGMAVGWLLGIGWLIFAAVHVILQIVSIIQLVAA